MVHFKAIDHSGPLNPEVVLNDKSDQTHAVTTFTAQTLQAVTTKRNKQIAKHC